MPTTYVTEHRLFVHEMARTNALDTISGALELLPTLKWLADDTIEVTEPLILFDAAFPGQFALEHENLVIDIPLGRYSIEFTYHEPVSSDDVWVTLVRLR